MKSLLKRVYWIFFKNKRERERERINSKNRKNLINQDFSILSSNCNGAVLLHDLGLEFRTPTVNLWLEPKDFIEFLKHLEHYLDSELTFSSELEKQYGYPVGLLDKKVKIYFQHYENQQEACKKWNERAKRVNMQNLFIMFTDRDNCTYNDIADFDALPYKNKVIFTHKPYPEFPSAFYIKGFEDDTSVGLVFTFETATSGKKYYDQFPYIDWFNGKLKGINNF